MPKFTFSPALAKSDVTSHGMVLSVSHTAEVFHVNHPVREGFDLSAFSGLDCRQIAPGQFYVVGAENLPQIDNVTVTDQSHGTALIELKDGNFLAVLASLTGADLGDSRLSNRTAIQSRLGHVSCNLKLVENGVSIIAPRSFADAIWSDLSEAMRLFG
jgi:heterotetrameric sarcosine oxidase gamma subunit